MRPERGQAERTTVDDRDRILGPGGGDRVHAIEYGWFTKMQPRLQWNPAAKRITPALTDGLCGGVRLRRSNLQCHRSGTKAIPCGPVFPTIALT
jgi:hypothetical protein